MLSSEMVQWAIRLILDCSPKAVIECQRTLWTSDVRPDVHIMTVPTLLIHGEQDQNAPLDFCAGRTTQLICRVDPPLALSRLRARGQMVEILDTDLRLSSAQVSGFLTQVMGLALSEDDMSLLEQRTKGWIAGLQLAALSLRRHHDVSAFIRALSVLFWIMYRMKS